MPLTGRQALLAVAAIVLVIAGSIAAQQVLALFVDFDAQDIRDWVDKFGFWGPLVYMTALMISIVFSPLPTAALALGAGLAYGVILGTIYTLIGGIVGGVICFWLARRFGRPWLARRISPGSLEYIDRLALVLGARLILLMRLVPVFGFEWVSYAAGLTKMRLSTYTVWTLIGSIPPVLAITYVGEQLDQNPWRSFAVFAGLVALALFTLIYLVVRRPSTGSAWLAAIRGEESLDSPTAVLKDQKESRGRSL